MAIEDFTFPIVSDALPRFIDSPPLWHSSSSSATTASGQHAGGEQDHPRKKADDEDEEEEEARMDLLWEDFNEKEVAHDSCGGDGSEEEMVKMGCVRGVTAPPRRAAGVLVFVKMLRKLFHLHHHPPHAF